MYTKSGDGVMRTTLNVPYRVTREERKELAQLAKQHGLTLRAYLQTALSNGIDMDYAQVTDEKDTDYKAEWHGGNN